MAEFRMPSLGAGMEAGTLVEWLVRPGDNVTRGDIIAVVDTHKGAIEVEVFESGVIEDLLVEEGTRVPVGTVLARIRTERPPERPPAPPAEKVRVERPKEAAPPPAVPRPALPAPPLAVPRPEEAPRPPAPPPPAVPTPAPERRRVRASPLARARAAELGIDLAGVEGTGPGGAVVLADVERSAAARAAPPPPPPPRISPVARRVAEELGVDLAEVEGTGTGGAITRADVERAARAIRPAAAPPAAAAAERLAAMRQAIARAMERSKREIPHYYLSTDIDMSRALAWIKAENLKRSMTERLLPGVLLLKAVALALHEVPELNGFWVEGTFRPSEAIHVGVGISLRGGGLVAPALHDTDRKTVDELMRALRDLVQRARAGSMRSSEVSDPTITVTDLGERGVGAVFGIIYPPQVALVGFGRVVERPWAAKGMIGPRPIVTATLSADHRASDGHRGGLFLKAVDRLLQQPEQL